MKLQTNLTNKPVIIVGGGPVGLFTSIMLSRYNVPSLLVEKSDSTTVYPKARLINGRTMEVFRYIGVEDQIRNAALPPQESDHSVWVKTLADGNEISRRRMLTIAPNEVVEKITPCPGCTSSQIDVERILFDKANESAAKSSSEVKFSVELKSLSQESDGVSATILDHSTDSEEVVHARYLIGADGGHSLVRDILGIGTIGDKGLTQWVNIVFRADLSPWARGRRINICMIQNPDAPGALMPVANMKDTWTFGAVVQSSLKDYKSDEFCKQKVRLAVGVPELPVEIIRVGPWSVTARYSEHFSDGRIFLVGDAAHETPPAGGFGMNTGIQDAFNLTWKLAFVTKGVASPELLRTYEMERQPVARYVVTQALLNIASHQPTRKDLLEETLSSLSGEKSIERSGVQSSAPQISIPSNRGKGSRSEHYNELGMIFGISYDKGAVVSDGTPLPTVSNPVTDYVPTARPGSRLPHVWLSQGNAMTSTIDLVGSYFLVLAGASGKGWSDAAEKIAQSSNIPLRAHVVGNESLPAHQWEQVFGVHSDGAILVRPDGHVAWRSPSLGGEPYKVLSNTLNSILFRN